MIFFALNSLGKWRQTTKSITQFACLKLQQFSRAPNVISNPCCNGVRGSQGLVNAPEVIPAVPVHHGSAVVLPFLLNAFVSLVRRRICMRSVRFWRSIIEVQMRSGTNWPTALRLLNCRQTLMSMAKSRAIPTDL